MIRFILQVAGFSFLYTLAMVATFPFLIYWGAPKSWQKWVQFLLAFPIDNEKIGVFSLPGMIAVVFLNGLIAGTVLIGLLKLGIFLKNLA